MKKINLTPKEMKMKKVQLRFVGDQDGWEDVGGSSENLPELNLKNASIGTHVTIVVGSIITGNSVHGQWVAYVVLDTSDNVKKMMYTTKVLSNALGAVQKGSTVRITTLGKPQGKNYFMYKVQVNRNIPINDQFEYEDNKVQQPQQVQQYQQHQQPQQANLGTSGVGNQQQAPNQQFANPGTSIDEDLPF